MIFDLDNNLINDYNPEEGYVKEEKVAAEYIVSTAENGANIAELKPIIPLCEAENGSLYIHIKRYYAYTEEEKEEYIKNKLRERREKECFNIVNRGAVFYSLITDEQYTALFDWYVSWLNVTETKIIPIRPSFLDEKLNVNNMEVL